MKKIYQKPETKAVEINTEQFIATSAYGPQVEKFSLEYDDADREFD